MLIRGHVGKEADCVLTFFRVCYLLFSPLFIYRDAYSYSINLKLYLNRTGGLRRYNGSLLEDAEATYKRTAIFNDVLRVDRTAPSDYY